MSLDQLPLERLVWIALAWVVYFLLHSLLASLGVKRWVARSRPRWMPAYRIFFNSSAILLLIPPLVLTYLERGPWLWQWTGAGWWIANGLAALAVFGFVYSLRWYDGAEFLGLRQWRGNVRAVEDQERFRVSPLHRFVRHPWYSLGLVLVWTRDMDAPLLLTAVMISLYFAIGSRLEELKLMTYHGDVYGRYRRLVPSLIPLPWRYLTPEQCRRLVARTNDHDDAPAAESESKGYEMGASPLTPALSPGGEGDRERATRDFSGNEASSNGENNTSE